MIYTPLEGHLDVPSTQISDSFNTVVSICSRLIESAHSVYAEAREYLTLRGVRQYVAGCHFSVHTQLTVRFHVGTVYGSVSAFILISFHD